MFDLSSCISALLLHHPADMPDDLVARGGGPLPSILRLPIELQLLILNLSPYQTVLQLRLVSRHFRDLVSRPALLRHYNKERKRLLADETAERVRRGLRFYPVEMPLDNSWNGPTYPTLTNPSSQESLTCYTCLKQVTPDRFSYSMQFGARCIGQWGAETRVCIPCGVRTAFYGRGNTTLAGERVCLTCGVLMYPSHGEPILDHSDCLWCERCLGLYNSHERLRQRSAHHHFKKEERTRAQQRFRQLKRHALRRRHGIETEEDRARQEAGWQGSMTSLTEQTRAIVDNLDRNAFQTRLFRNRVESLYHRKKTESQEA
jgi:hypothetical protein